MHIGSHGALPSTSYPYQPWPLEPEVIIAPPLVENMDSVSNSDCALEKQHIPFPQGPLQKSAHAPFMPRWTGKGPEPGEADMQRQAAIQEISEEINPTVEYPPAVVNNVPDICHPQPSVAKTVCRPLCKKIKCLTGLVIFGAGAAAGAILSWHHFKNNACDCPQPDVDIFDPQDVPPLL